MHVLLHALLYFVAQEHVADVAVYHSLEHHLRMVGGSALPEAEAVEWSQVEAVNQGVHHPDRFILGYVPVYPLGKKRQLPLG